MWDLIRRGGAIYGRLLRRRRVARRDVGLDARRRCLLGRDVKVEEEVAVAAVLVVVRGPIGGSFLLEIILVVWWG